jgi:hypothetical protein
MNIVEKEFEKILMKIHARKDNIELIEAIQTRACKIGIKHSSCVDIWIDTGSDGKFDEQGIYTTRHIICAKRIVKAFELRKFKRLQEKLENMSEPVSNSVTEHGSNIEKSIVHETLQLIPLPLSQEQLTKRATSNTISSSVEDPSSIIKKRSVS